jgi:hypothetical protein
MAAKLKLIPGSTIRWGARRFVVVDYVGLDAVIAREVGKRKLERIPVRVANPGLSSRDLDLGTERCPFLGQRRERQAFRLPPQQRPKAFNRVVRSTGTPFRSPLGLPHSIPDHLTSERNKPRKRSQSGSHSRPHAPNGAPGTAGTYRPFCSA